MQYLFVSLFITSNFTGLHSIAREEYENGTLDTLVKQFWYRPGTSLSSCRVHLGSFHAQIWAQTAYENGWKASKPLRAALERFQYIATTQTPEQRAGPQGKVPFSSDEFVKHIVKFIVADDQVRDFPVFFS